MPKKFELNLNQKKAVQQQKGAFLVVAGAGTGKTRVITERVKWLLLQQKNLVTSYENVLALTFTDKAAKEMLLRLGDIMPLGYQEPWVYTFHSFADRILRTEGLEIGLDPSYKIISYPEQWLLIRKNLFKLNLEYFRPLGNPTKFISAILKFISRLQDENISDKEFRKFANDFAGESDEKKRWQELAYVYEKYNELKLGKHTKLDFGDLINFTIKLFEERPNILNKYQDQFKHIMIDEFQDTNYAQYKLIKLLYSQNQNNNRSLMVVGDDSQSIYKFRGAAISNILQFKNDYPDAEMITLLENYRSTQDILDPAYELIQNNNPDTLEHKLGISKKLVSTVESAVKTRFIASASQPQVIQVETLENEVDYVVKKIYEILGNEPQYTYKDIAILARANNQLDPFVMALRQNQIPYQLVGNRGLYDREEIRDILAFLRVVIDSTDSINLYRVLNIDSLNIKYEVISKLLSDSKRSRNNLYKELVQATDENLILLAKKIKDLQEQITKQTPTEFVYNLVYSIKYLEQFLQEETVENQLCIKNLNIFLDRIKKFESDYYSDTKEYPNVVDLVDYLDLMIEAGENPAQAEIEDIDTVNLMTVHASKGLEFSVVFIINMVEGRFPVRDRKDPIEIPDELIKETLPTGDEHIQEERRLFYVGMTRAQKYLYITYANDYGGKTQRNASGFLNETKLEITKVEGELNLQKDKSAQQEFLFGIKSNYRQAVAHEIKEFVPEKVSYSQINMYGNCPLQYKYKYVLNVPTLPNHALSFGSTIHATLKDFHTKKMFDPKVSFNDLTEIYKRNWEPLGYTDEDHRTAQFESGVSLLKRYFEKHVHDSTKPIALEKNFNVTFDGIKFTGKIDRIDPLGNGSVEIVDYKTGSSKSQKDVDKDDQLTFYAIAVKEAMNLIPEKLTYYFLETGEQVTTTRNEEQLKKAKEKVKEVVDKMKSGEFKANPGMICEWCDYKSICPFVWKG